METLVEQQLIDAATMCRWLQNDEAILVDVRESDEFAAERIPGARTLPLSRFDPAAVPRAPGKKTVLTCFIGGRSAKAAARLAEIGRSGAFQLDGGLFAWKEAGFATES